MGRGKDGQHVTENIGEHMRRAHLLGSLHRLLLEEVVTVTQLYNETSPEAKTGSKVVVALDTWLKALNARTEKELQVPLYRCGCSRGT